MRVLVGYDGSACSQTAVADLDRAGLPDGTEILLLTAVDVWPGSQPDRSPTELLDLVSRSAGTDMARTRAAVAENLAAVEEAAIALRQGHPRWHISSDERVGAPGQTLLAIARDLPADLVCVGCHARSSLGRMVFGSVSHAVMSSAGCPVRITRWCPPVTAGPQRLLLYIGVDPVSGLSALSRALALRLWPDATQMRLIVPEVLTGRLERRDVTDRFIGQPIAPSLYVNPKGESPSLLETAIEWRADCVMAPRLADAPILPDGLTVDALLVQARCSVEVIPFETTPPG